MDALSNFTHHAQDSILPVGLPYASAIDRVTLEFAITGTTETVRQMQSRLVGPGPTMARRGEITHGSSGGNRWRREIAWRADAFPDGGEVEDGEQGGC